MVKHAGTILFWLTYLTVVGLTVILFPRFSVNMLICHIPLIGWASWIFGRTGGLLIALSLLIFGAYMLSILHGEIAEYFVAKASGSAIYVFTALLVGLFRSNYDNIKATNAHLDQLVAMRDQELRALTWRLLNNSEQQRMNRGRNIHDGIGQQLTGARLLSSSLRDQLAKQKSPEFERADFIAARIGKIHDILRRVARVLFPVSITETGLIPAMLELGAALKEIKNVDVLVFDQSNGIELPDPISLQLYRICQETVMHAVLSAKATWTRIVLEASDEQLTLSISHNGEQRTMETPDSYLQLIDYRLSQISGHSRIQPIHGGATTHLFTLQMAYGGGMR